MRVRWPRLDQAETRRAVDRAAPAGNAELAVHRDRLRLDRVPGHVELLADLAKRKLCSEEWEEPQLRGGQRRPRAVDVRDRFHLSLERRGFVCQNADVRAVA